MITPDLITILLLPSLVSGGNSTEAYVEDSNSSWEEQVQRDLSGNFPVTQPTPRPPGDDQLLEEVNREVQRLNLEDYADDYFDHLEDNSNEIRRIIQMRRRSQQQKRNAEESTTSSTPAIISRGQTETEYPILTSTTDNVPTSSTSSPPPTPSLFKKVSTGVQGAATSVIGTLTNPFKKAGRSLFGREDTTQSPLPMSLPDECNTTTQIYFQGACRNLFTNDKCPPTEWLVEDPVTLTPKCVENRCKNVSGNTAPFGNSSCVRVGSSDACHPGMRTYIYRSGIVQCDCKPGHLFHEVDGNCYEANRQGPCSTGQHFVFSKKDRRPVCWPNPCLYDGYFCNAPRCPRQRNCQRLGEPCETNNSNRTGKYMVDAKTLTPFCQVEDALASSPIIGNVPTLSCAPGSRRDILGNCRTPTTIDFS